MTFKRAIPPCTPEQQARQDRARALGCIYCRMNEEKNGHISSLRLAAQPTTEIHHLTVCGRQISQDYTVAACSWHHRAICIPGMRSSDMARIFGPSLAKGSKTFREHFCSDAEALEYQNKLLEGK